MEVILLKKGLSVIESIVAVAILAIVMLMMSPMVKNYGMVYDRINLQNRIDYEFGKILEIIKRKVRASRVDEDYVVDASGTNAEAVEVLTGYTGIYDEIISELRLLVPNEDNDPDENYIAFRVIEDSSTDSDGDGINDRSLVYVTNPGENSYISSENESKTVIIDYIDDLDYDGDGTDDHEYFEYKEGVVLIYLDLDIDRMTGESIEGKRDILDKIRDAAVTRINIDMSKNF
jgi:hypothetical protein